VLAQYAVESFHANKMAHWAAPYDTWRTADGARDEAKRIAFLRALTHVIKSEVMKAFSVTMTLNDYDEVNADFALDGEFTPYGLCAMQIMRRVHRWMQKTHPGDDTLFVFERGDADQHDLFRMLKREHIHTGHDPLVLPKRWTDADGAVHYRRAFEACDWWAYEDALAVSMIGTGKTARQSVLHLSKQISCDRNGYRREGLVAICAALHVPRRLGQPEKPRRPHRQGGTPSSGGC
jgi:hypothetical protein